MALADDVRTWATATWEPQMPLHTWWAALADAGHAFPTWPDGLGGRSRSTAEALAVGRALQDAGVLGAPTGVGQSLAGPTLIVHGTAEQQERYLPALAHGEECWCQLFSEPGAGSDLAGLQTKAITDGDEYVVNGQKVWNSGASRSERGLLIARTDPTVPKHKGITFFVIDMRQPGIDVRPLRQMNGDVDFDEVFLTDATASADDVIGGVGAGWAVAQTTLAVERTSIGGARAEGGGVPAGRLTGLLDQPVGPILDQMRSRSKSPIGGYVIGSRAMVQLAKDMGNADDPVVRQKLVRHRSLTEIHRLTGRRARAQLSRDGRPGPGSSIGKLAMSNLARSSRDLAMTLLGPYGMLAGEDAPLGGAVQHVVLSSFAAGLGGGTDEIQRNVIGERALGLPKEPATDREAPFRDVAKGTPPATHRSTDNG